MPRFFDQLIASCLRASASAVATWALLGPQAVEAAAAPAHLAGDLIGRYCMDCHDDSITKGGLSLEGIAAKSPATNPELWEKILRKIDHQQMPPIGEERPSSAEYRQVVTFLKAELDRAATAAPDPGRTDTFRRLNRTEYQNAIRDLLALEIDATTLLPNDEPARGFDNVTVGNLSTTLLDRYVSAAQKIARLAIGAPRKTPGGDTFRVPPDLTQEGHIAGLPLGTRGGALISYTFPQDGEYEIQVRLARDRNEQVEGLKAPHDVEVLIDGARVALATVKPPGADKNAEGVDTHLKFRVPVKAGPHQVGVTFIKNPSVLIETERQPFVARFNMHRHPRTAPALYQTSITGPFNATGPGDTPSRRLIFGEIASVAARANDEAHARAILAPLLRRAYRRPINDDDLRRPLQFFREGSAEGAGFEAGIESALAAILVAPQFLIRVETDPAGLAPGTVYRISDLELASRLSFFLWSSLPDDALLEAAGRGELRRPAGLEQQVRRMLADPRARNLATNFAAQWLHLRGLESVAPDVRRFIDFDDNLRHSMRRETELFFENIMTADRPVTELISADYSFLDERLAKHYGVPHLYGSHFRRVSFAGMAERQRGGLLRQGSILTVTSYATRTSPVIRGNWILANLVGAPAPPPPPNVPALDDGHVSAALPIRARLAAHREKPVCASCHNLMDPVGFSLENFDAVGRWRTAEERLPVDATGGFPDGSKFEGVAGLEQALLARPDLFAATLTEKLLTFALGRGVELSDASAVRAIVRRAEAEDFRFSALVLGLVNSPPFQLRRTPNP
jgi:mono/diheme cytochrome c family protein